MSEQRIVPFLWFDGRLQEAMEFYTSVFEDSRILSTSNYGEAGPGEPGTLMAATFELRGVTFSGLNGGPQYSFTPAVSFSVDCKDQAEVDRYWDALTADGGEGVACGWLRDKFGLSWQIVPDRFFELMGEGDADASRRVMSAMLAMVKMDVAGLERAFRGEDA